MHAPLDQTHKFVLLAVALASIALCFVVLSSVLRQPGPGRWCIAIGLPTAVLFATPAIGSREHLAVMGLTPWVLSTALADRTKSHPALGVALGLAAGCAMLLKPYFAVFGLTVGLVDLARVRDRLDRLTLGHGLQALFLSRSISVCFSLFRHISARWFHSRSKHSGDSARLDFKR